MLLKTRDAKPVMSEPVNRFMGEPVFLKNDPFEKLSIFVKTGLNRFLKPVYKGTGVLVGLTGDDLSRFDLKNPIFMKKSFSELLQ